MKKIKHFILIMLLIILSCGCSEEKELEKEKEKESSSWKNKIQISELTFDDEHILGEIKNVTNNAYDVHLWIIAKSGTLEKEISCFELIRPKESAKLECLALDIDDSYSLKIDDVSLEKKKIPSLEEGEMDVDTLEYHFPKILDKYTYNMIGFYATFDADYPSIDKINYDGKFLEISGDIESDKNIIKCNFEFDTSDNTINSVYFYVNNLEKSNEVDEKFLEDVIFNITFLDIFDRTYHSSIVKVLETKNMDEKKCMLFDEYCISVRYPKPEKFKDGIFFYISKYEKN